MYDYVHRSRIIPSPGAAKDLTHPSLEDMTHDRVADLAASRDSEAGIPRRVGMVVDRHQGPVSLLAPSIAPDEVPAAAQPLVTAQPFIDR